MSRKLGRPATPAEAAKYGLVSLRTMRRWIASGQVPAYRIGPRLVRVDLDDIDKMVRRIPAAPRSA